MVYQINTNLPGNGRKILSLITLAAIHESLYFNQGEGGSLTTHSRAEDKMIKLTRKKGFDWSNSEHAWGFLPFWIKRSRDFP